MSNEFEVGHCSAVTLDRQLASDELNCSDFLDMVDWSNLGMSVLDEALPGFERQMQDSSFTHTNPSDIHETQNAYASELDILAAETDGTLPNQSNDEDFINMNDPETLATFTSLVLFANNPLAQQIELKARDHLHQATIQGLAMRLNLHCVPDVSSTTVYLRKYSHEETVIGLGQQISSTVDEPSDPATTRFEDLKHGNTTYQSSPTDKAHDSFAIHVPGLSSHNTQIDHDHHDAFSNNSHLRKTECAPLLSSTPPPLSPPRHRLSSDHGSTLSIHTSVDSCSWQDSFPALSRTLKVIGACWRCKILRKKCGPDQPCKACPKAENKSRWQNIGCKRGNLLDHCPHICLCPKSIAQRGRQSRQTVIASESYSQTIRGAKIYLQGAFDRLGSILDSADDAYINVVLDILCSPIVDLDTMRLSRDHNLENNLLIIAWTLVDSPSVKAILQVEHVDQTIDVIKAAIVYETEYGRSSTAALAIECLRNCVDMLRLHEPGYLTPALHANCDFRQCRVESFRKLSSGINAFIEEFSRVIFRKENRANERKWWLSAFYSLYIQSFVRRAITFVEEQSLAHLRDSHPELHLNCSDYLNLAVHLFEAASASYDPLISTWSLEKEPIDHKFDLRLIKYYRIAQEALRTHLWAQSDVQSSFEFISLAFGEDLSSTMHRQNKQDVFPTLPLRPMMQRSSIESTTHRFNNGTSIESDVIYESESGSRVSSPAIDSSLLQKLSGKGAGRLRTSSGAKRRASSPPQSDGSVRRNDSSSSMLNITAMRRRGLSFATQSSPLSSPYLVAYDSTTSPKWNGSEDSLSHLSQVLNSDSPAPQGSHEFAGSTTLRTPSLHNKSSNESFLEMPRFLNRKRSRANLARSKVSEQVFVCECCPKKPKMFDSAEALSVHESEKQYKCSYCGNRFKTKNEAERHQNSLHIRRQSWSCLELHEAGYTHAFRKSSAQAGLNVTCCYCGVEISETNARDNGNGLIEGIWDTRLKHLKDAHKFGECNTSKKFYRADHFRQHLRHSHAAVLGDGTSHLEAVCMKEVRTPVATANTI